MANYTMTIQDILLDYIEETQYTPQDLRAQTLCVDPSVQLAIFDFDYSIPLNQPMFQERFLKRFFTREIGMETVDLFKLKLENILVENADKYNLLYDQLLVDYKIRNANSYQMNKNEQFDGNTTDTTDSTTASNSAQQDRSTLQETINDTTNAQTHDTSDTRRNDNTSNRLNVGTIFADTPDSRLTNVTVNPNNDTFALTYASTLTDQLQRANATLAHTGNTTNRSTSSAVNNNNRNNVQTGNQSITIDGTSNENKRGTANHNRTNTETKQYLENNDNQAMRQFLNIYQTILQIILSDCEIIFMGVF